MPHPPQLLFPTADFSDLTVGQKWDRVRLTCSQPFSPCSRFGLSFVRLRTPQEQEPDPPRPPLDTVGVSYTFVYPSPWGDSRKGLLLHRHCLCPVESSGGTCWAELGAVPRVVGTWELSQLPGASPCPTGDCQALRHTLVLQPCLSPDFLA